MLARLTRDEVRLGLLRLRGDLGVAAEPQSTQATAQAHESLSVVADFLERHNENFSPSAAVAALVAECGEEIEPAPQYARRCGKDGAMVAAPAHRRGIALTALHDWLLSLKEPDAGNFNERGWTRDRAAAHAKTMGSTNVAKGGGEGAGGLTKEMIVAACRHLDPNGDGIDLDELTRAFRGARRANAAQLMEHGARAVLAAMCAKLRSKAAADGAAAGGVDAAAAVPDGGADGAAALEAIFLALDTDADGAVTHAELRRALGEAGADEVGARIVVRFLDPNNDGTIDRDELERAFELARHSERVDRDHRAALAAVAAANAHVDAQAARSDGPKPFTEAEMDVMIKGWLDPSGDGLIEFKEFADAIFRARRAKAEEKYIAEGKGTMRRLLERLASVAKPKPLSLKQWFDQMDGAGAASANATVTARELRLGVKAIRKASGVTLLDEGELMALLRFIDKSGEGDVSYKEMTDAVAKLDTPTEAEKIGAMLGDTFERFEAAIKGKQLLTVFRSADKTCRGIITTAELRAEFGTLMAPSGRVRALLACALYDSYA